MKKTILIAAVMFFAFSVAASAQALLQVGSTPVTTVASCGTAELTGKVVFSIALPSLPVTTGTITINYGVPITSVDQSLWTVNGAPATGILGNLSTTDELKAGRLVVSITPTVEILTFSIEGVRVNIADSGLTSLTATVTATGNSFLGGQTSVLVINSIASALSKTVTVTPASLKSISSITTATSVGPAVITLKEGFLNGWVLGAGIQLSFSAIPAGFTLTFPTSATSATAGSTFQLVNADLSTATAPKTAYASTTAAPQGAFSVYYRLTTLGTAPDTVLETLPISVTVDIAATPRPLAQSTVTVQANMATFPAGTVPNYSGTTCQTDSATVLAVVAANTNLLITYATTSAGYDVGIAISNTTSDPFTAGATKQDGSITFYFYPTTGSAFRYPAAGGTLDVGSGLTSGVLPTGKTYVVLLSELLGKAGYQGEFSGYIIVTANFTNAHGQYFVTDFEAFTNGALMLVVNPATRKDTPEGLNN